ncbi:MAG TPA: hypothetical protein VE863_09425 [Pyrinomonadaceae bacterium]|jgi:hypothetical protein|nr:hypothetical protein [Pyrinomonadaceae bacterium]
MKKRTARVTIETERLLVISHSSQSIESWCEACADRVRFVPIDEAAAVAGVSQRTIFRWAEAAAIHLRETPNGKAMFCLNSITLELNSRRLLR